MGLRLSVQRRAWTHSVDAAAVARPGLIPVVKGNGYGFGRPTLMPIARRLTTNAQIAVGTVYEAADVPVDAVALVLTPHVDALPADLPPSAVLTVGDAAHVEALRRNGWGGAVSIKLASSMHRYGADPVGLTEVLAAVTSAGMTPVGVAIHLPLAGTDEQRRAEIETWLARIDASLPVAVSHLSPASYEALRSSHPEHAFQLRCGSLLWHADKTLVHLTADVVDVHAVAGGTSAGYHATAVPGDGHIVLVAAGSAHGVRALDDGRSPFHIARRRVALLEPPHMHTSMLFVPAGDEVPPIGTRIDVQRPLITTNVDELVWVDD